MSRGASNGGRGIEVEWWIGGGGAVSRAKASSVARSLIRKAVPSKSASLEHISIMELSAGSSELGRCLLGLAELGVIIVEFFFRV